MKFTGENMSVSDELSEKGFKVGDELYATNYALTNKGNSVELELDTVRGVLATSKNQIGNPGEDPICYFVPYAFTLTTPLFKLAWDVNERQYATTLEEMTELFQANVPKIKEALKGCFGSQLEDE